MSNFDPITFAAIRRLNNGGSSTTGTGREVGEPMIVPTGFSDPDFLDAGSVIDPVLYPKLAAAMTAVPHISSLTELNLPEFSVSKSVLVSQKAGAKDGKLFMFDFTTSRVVKSTDGVNWELHGYAQLPVNYGNFSSFYSFNGDFYLSTVTGGVAATWTFKSTDGLSWNLIGSVAVNSAYPSAFNNLAVGNLHFIFSGATSTTIQTSPNGATWTSVTMPGATTTWKHVAWNGTTYCCVSGTTAAATSPDGATWTSRTLPVACGSIKVVNGLFVACPLTSITNVYTSPDGITWTARPVGATVAGITNIIQTSDSVYLASTTTVHQSSDGITWTARPVQTAQVGYVVTSPEVNIVVQGGGTAGNVLYGSTNKMETLTLSTAALPTPSAFWTVFAASPTCMIAYDSQQNSITTLPNTVAYRSIDNGETWTSFNLPAGFKPTAMTYITSSSVFLMIMKAASLTSTDDGVTWTQSALPLPLRDPVFTCKSDPSYATIAFGGALYRTADGINLTNIMPVFLNTDTPIASFFQGKMIMSSTSSSAGFSAVSLNVEPSTPTLTMTTVSGSALPAAVSALRIQSIASNSAIIVALPYVATGTAASNTFAYSFDGMGWTAGTLPISASWSEVVWTGSMFVAIPTNHVSIGSNQIYPITTVVVSYDGIEWEVYDVSRHFTSGADVGSPKQTSVFVGGDGCAYFTTVNRGKVLKLDSNASPRVPYLTPPSPTMKYVVKAK